MKRIALSLVLLAAPVMAAASPADFVGTPVDTYCRNMASQAFSFGPQVYRDCMVKIDKKHGKPAPKRAPGILGPDQATEAAITILKGEPYGYSRASLIDGIKSQILVIKGNDPCSGAAVQEPAWIFRVEALDQNSRSTSGEPAKINGYLTINALTGKMNCSGLPYLN